MREVYLDNSATTPVLPTVAALMQHVLVEDFGNPSSLHRKGVVAERIKTEARRTLAAACGVGESQFYFTSGGTEANNLAIKGVARRRKRRGTHLLTTKIEHPSVLYAFRALEAEGFTVTYLDVNHQGFVEPAAVAAALQDDTILVSMMHVNNEVGIILPVAAVGQLIKQRNPDILYHVDAVQSFGKLPVRPQDWQADLVTISAHKIHGPKGTGALYKREAILLEPLLHGGDQESGVRPGTENTAGIAGFAKATELALRCREENLMQMQKLKERFLARLLATISDITVNSSPAGAPHILNINVAGIKGEVLVHALEEHGVYISTGSACHSQRAGPSHVLLAMGRKEKEIAATLRISFSSQTTEDEIDYALVRLQEAVHSLRLFTRRSK